MSNNYSLGVLAAMLAACSTPVIHEESPALLTNPGSATTLELEQTIAAAMDTMKVSLAPDALTTSSHLTIEPGMQRSIDKPPELGRNPGRPDHFQLLIDGPQCVLVHEKTGLHWLLNTVECVAQ